MDRSRLGVRKPHIYRFMGEYVVRFDWRMSQDDIVAACVYATNINGKLKRG